MSKTKANTTPSFDIQIREVEKTQYHIENKILSNANYKFDVPKHSKLSLEISGKDLDFRIVNTIRRVVLDDIPTYAFPTGLITVSANTSIFNNDQMRLRLSQLPIINTDCDLFYLESRYSKDVNYNDPKRLIHPLEKKIEISVNAYNDSNKLKYVTTNDIKYYEDGEEIKNKYNTTCPPLLVQLRPSETFICSMRASLGHGDTDDIWAAVSNAYYEDIGNDIDQKIVLHLESQGQLDEYDILIKSCKYIKYKLEEIKKLIDTRFKSKEIETINNKLLLRFNNEDHTMGELLNYAFQNHPHIIFSGTSKQDHLIKSIQIIIEYSKEMKSPLDPIFEQIEYLTNMYDHIEKQLTKLNVSKVSNSSRKKK